MTFSDILSRNACFWALNCRLQFGSDHHIYENANTQKKIIE